MNQVESFKYNLSTSVATGNSYIATTADNASSVILADTLTTDSTEIEDLPEKGKYSVFEVANWFLLQQNMTHKKLQKLCYYAQAWCYALKGYKLMNADFQAWVHGPVCPALYERFKGFGYETISIRTDHMPKFDKADIQLLEDVWETYGSKTGNSLEALSHRETPWIEARRGYTDTEKCAMVISEESMKRYYRSIYSGEQTWQD